MTYTPPTFEMLGLLALASYLCAPAIRKLFEPEIQRAMQVASGFNTQHEASLSATAPAMDRLGRRPRSVGIETVVGLSGQERSPEGGPAVDENLDDSLAVSALIASVGNVLDGRP